MAGVAVLQPHDVLKQRVSYRQTYAKPVRSRRNSTSNPLPSPNPNPKNNRRKRSPQKKNGSADVSTSPPAKNGPLVMGEVKILKRGQVLINKECLNVVKENKLVSDDGFVEKDLVVLSTPEPDRVPKQITTMADFYAGSAFFVCSPPPSSLPVPVFFKKKSKEDNHDATSDLRRLLRLDLD